MTEKLGVPEIVPLSCQRISRIKAYLAAGWVVVLGTHVMDQFRGVQGCNEMGFLLRRYRAITE
jgi:hypothetical protein